LKALIGAALALLAGAAHADEPGAGEGDPKWRELVAAAKDDLAHDRLADARDHAFDAQRRRDAPETSALLASALFGLGLVEDDKTQLSHASLMAEKCLQQLAFPEPGADPRQRAAVRLSCLSVAARAYQQLGDNRSAHERALACAALPAGSLAQARLQLACRRILEQSEAQGYGAHGGTWWRYVVATAQIGYGLRWLSATLASPGARLDGYNFEGAVGYPNLSLGPLLLRAEIVLRLETLAAEVLRAESCTTNMPASCSYMPTTSSASVLSIGGRVAITYPGRLMTLEVALGVSGAELRAPRTLEITDHTGMLQSYGASDWAPEIGVLIRLGTPEVRVGGLSFVFATFIETAYAFDWHLDPPPPLDPTTNGRNLNSFAVRYGIALRFRFGDLKSYL
jgi:hypothetical protein